MKNYPACQGLIDLTDLFCLLASSADNLSKHFGHRSGMSLQPDLYTTFSERIFFKKLNLKKKSADNKKHAHKELNDLTGSLYETFILETVGA